MHEIFKMFLEKLAKHFWSAVFLTLLTLFILASYNSPYYNYNLFESVHGTAQALTSILLILSGYYLVLSFIKNRFIALNNFLFRMRQNKEYKQNFRQNLTQYIENIFENNNYSVLMNSDISPDKLKLYLFQLYKRNIKSLKANELSDILEKEVEEQNQNVEDNGFYVSLLSNNECIKIQNYLYKLGLLSFENNLYIVNDLIFKKLKELGNRGMLNNFDNNGTTLISIYRPS